MAIKIGSKEAQNWQEKLHKSIVFLIYVLVFVTPSISFRSLNEIFEFPKMTFVYVFGGTVIFLYFLKRILWEKGMNYKKWLTPLSNCVRLFLLANVISTIFSMSKYTSIWGYYTRYNGGLVSMVIYFFLFFVVARELNLKEKERVKDLIIFSVIPVCLYAIAQHFGFERGYWEEDSQARVFSTLGQPNWLAAYLVLTLFLTFEKALKEKEYKWLLGGLIIINLSSLWFTYSLSGILGALVGGAAFFGILIKKEEKLLKQNLKFLLVTFSVFLFIAITNLGVIGPKLKDAILDVRNNISSTFIAYAEETAAPKRDFGDTTAIRLILWKGTKNLIFSSPKNFLIGSGPETYPYAFAPFRPDELNTSSEWNFVFNKPHNYYLEIFANLGLVGLVAYLALVIFSLKSGLVKKEWGVVAALLGFFVTNVFGWPTVVGNLIFFIYLGLIEKEYE